MTNSKVPTKILVVRVGRAGDIVMITPALKALLDNDSSSEIHLLSTNDAERVLSGFHKQLTKIIVYNRRAILAYLERKKIKAAILTEKYDRIYCFEYDLSYRTLLAGHDNVRFIADAPANTITHYSQHCLDTLQYDIEIDSSNTHLNLPVTENADNMAAELLKNIKSKNTFIIGFHPTFSGIKKGKLRLKTNHENRLWSPDKFAELANKLFQFAEQSNIDIKIVMDLLPEEEAIGNQILQSTSGKIFMFTEKPNFQRYKAILKSMDLLITTNTGPMHIAAAVGTENLVVLFGGKHHPDECGPFIPKNRYTALHTRDTGKPELGLNAIDPQVVFQACLKYLPN